jgi:TPR repeat protein
LRWKQGGFDWLKADEKKAATQTTEAPQGQTDSGTAPNAAPTAGGSAPNAATSGLATPPATDGSAPAATAPPSAQASPQTSLSQNPTPPAASPQAPQAQAPDTNPNPSAPPANSASPPADSDSSVEPPPAEAPVPKARAPKPSAAKPVDTATEAERYIYGRGVRQDCDRGLRMLRPAAEQSNPKAMIALGALYCTGTCTPRDLPTAYRWFALALHKQPDNQALQDDLQKLWSQMTQPERQLAIKLSQ